MKPSRRAIARAAAIGLVLHTLTVLWLWWRWDYFGRGNAIALLDLPSSFAYMHLDGRPLLTWSLTAGGLQWAVYGALLAFFIGRAARKAE